MSTSIPACRLLLLALLTFGTSACQATKRVFPKSSRGAAATQASLGSMHHVCEVDGVWIGSRPSPADLDLARRRGIAMAIDLSLPDEEPGYDVLATCASNGIAYLHPRVRPGGIPDETIDRVLAALREPDRRPLLMFCSDGNRAAMMFAIWRVLDGGIGIEDAIVEARRSGMKPGVSESFVRLQVARRTQHPEPAAITRA